MIHYKFMKLNRYASVFDDYRRHRYLLFPYELNQFKIPYEEGLVSIILPVYNGEYYLSEALESILTQSYHSFELIVVNDGSIDSTKDILEYYAKKDSRIKIVDRPHQGLPVSLSTGFRLARGEFLTWTSDDNRMRSSYLQQMVACLKRHPTWDMIYANIDIIDENGNPLKNSQWYLHYQRPPGSEHIYFPEDPVELNTYPNNYIGAAFLYRARVDWLIGDYSALRFGMEDYDYWMQVNSLMCIRHSDFDEPLYEYRLHSRSLTAHDNEIGITKRRENLMVFDTFRRDFYLMSMCWYLENDSLSTEYNLIWEALENVIYKSKGIVINRNTIPSEVFPRLWVPSVYLKGWDGKGCIPTPPSDLPQNCIQILFCLDPNTNLPNDVDERWNFCVVWGKPAFIPRLRNSRQGWVAVQDAGAMITALDIFTRTSHLKKIEEEILFPRSTKKQISVIVCTYRRKDLLEECLYSLLHQNYYKHDYEIIVVNNDPTDMQVNDLVYKLDENAISKSYPQIRLVLCPIPGLSAARNAGISEAEGEILCFIDDDAVANSDWLHQIYLTMQNHKDIGIGGGTILLRIPEPRPNALWEGWEPIWSEFKISGSGYRIVQNWWEYPWGANWFARKQLLIEMGGFRTSYGRIGHNYSGAEEVVAAALANKLGYQIVLLPEAIVYHNVESSRFTYKHVWNTQIHGIMSAYQIQRDLYIPYTYNIPFCIRRVIYLFITMWFYLSPWKWKPGSFILRFFSMLGFLKLTIKLIRWYFYRFRFSFTIKDP